MLIAWENEAFLALEELGKDQFEIVVPSLSIKAEPPVAVVDANVDRKGTRKLAEAYLDFLYSPVGQKLAAKHFFRPTKPEFADPADLAALSQAQYGVDRRSAVWRLGQGAGAAFRRGRDLRSDLQADQRYSRQMTARRNWLPPLRQASVIPGFGLALGYS